MQARQFCRRFRQGTGRPLWLSAADRDDWVLPVAMHMMLYTPAELAFVLSLAVHAVCDVQTHFMTTGKNALRRSVQAMLGFHVFRSNRVVPAPAPPSAVDGPQPTAAQADHQALNQTATALLLQLPAERADSVAANSAADAPASPLRNTRVMWRDAARSAAIVHRHTAPEAESSDAFPDAARATPNAIGGSGRRSGMAAILGVLAAAAHWRGNSAARFVRAWLQV